MSGRPRSFRLDRSVRRVDGGRTLIGGAPLRVLRLTDAGARLVERVAAGQAVSTGGATGALLERMVEGGLLHPEPEGPAPFGPGDVTVVIPVRDHPVDDTLGHLGEVAAVLVVDDGSAVEVPTRRQSIVLRRPSPGGPAAARNTGLAAVATPLVAFVDADTTPQPGWLAAVLPHFADDRVAAVAPRVVAPGVDRRSGVLARYEAVRSPLDLGEEPGVVRPKGRVPYVPAAALVVRTEVLRALGGFDETLRYGEDVDLVWRLAEAGHRVRYEPAALVTHEPRPTLAGWLRQRFAYGTSAGPLHRRHRGAVAPVSMSPWSAAAWGAAVLGHPVVGAAVAAGTTAALVPKLRALDRPVPEALRLAGLGHLAAGRLLADAVRRVWWPLVAVAAVRSRRARRVLAASVLLPLVVDWRERRPALDPVRFALLRVLDDGAYATGVWVGAWRSRTLGPLVPALTPWPGRRGAVEEAAPATEAP